MILLLTPRATLSAIAKAAAVLVGRGDKANPGAAVRALRRVHLLPPPGPQSRGIVAANRALIDAVLGEVVRQRSLRSARTRARGKEPLMSAVALHKKRRCQEKQEARERLAEEAERGARGRAGAVRRAAQARLRHHGYTLQRSCDGSNYYVDYASQRQHIIRVSDHDVPLTCDRQDARDDGAFTWAGEPFVNVLNIETVEEARQVVDRLVGEA